MQVEPSASNLRVYNIPEVASHYGALDYLTPCERFLFDNYIKPGAAILDVGVGGGRTSAYLSRAASRYVGLDYSEEMVRVCREKFPELEFLVRDAADLSAFPDASFDTIVMAFNGLDYVLPDERRRHSSRQRRRCLEECRRALKDGGVLIFSSHNPRAVLVRPAWDRDRVRAFAKKLADEQRVWFQPFVLVLSAGKGVHAVARAAAGSTLRIVQRITRKAFWKGDGYLFDSAHGGLTTHCWVPARVTAELSQLSFRLATVMGDDYPSSSWQFVTDWYYYVFQK